MGGADAPLPVSKSQKKKWSKEIRGRLADWVANEIVPRLKQGLERQSKLIDYHAAVSGGLQLVPDDAALAKLASDYQNMVDDGLFLDDAEPFETLLQRCRVIQQKANAPSINFPVAE